MERVSRMDLMEGSLAVEEEEEEGFDFDDGVG